MSKKLIAACLAATALGLSLVTPGAPASPVLTDSGFVTPVGTSITGKNTGDVKFTGAFNVTCSTAHLRGSLTQNSGTQIKGSIPFGNAAFSGDALDGDCTSALGNVSFTMDTTLCFETVKNTDNVQLSTGCTSFTAAIAFTLKVTNLGSCRYNVVWINGTFTTNASAVMAFKEQEAKLWEGGIFCPTSGKLDMTFDLTRTGGLAFTIS